MRSRRLGIDGVTHAEIRDASHVYSSCSTYYYSLAWQISSFLARLFQSKFYVFLRRRRRLLLVYLLWGQAGGEDSRPEALLVCLMMAAVAVAAEEAVVAVSRATCAAQVGNNTWAGKGAGEIVQREQQKIYLQSSQKGGFRRLLLKYRMYISML